MNNPKVKYSCPDAKESFLCFTCAVRWALADWEIETEVGEWDSEYYTGQSYCFHPEVLPKIYKDHDHE